MHVELVHAVYGRKFYVNPRHVILIEPTFSEFAESDDQQPALTTDVILEGVGRLMVKGSPTEVRKILSTGGPR